MGVSEKSYGSVHPMKLSPHARGSMPHHMALFSTILGRVLFLGRAATTIADCGRGR